MEKSTIRHLRWQACSPSHPRHPTFCSLPSIQSHHPTKSNSRRTIQEAYNKEHGITPTTIKKAVRDLIAVSKAVAETEVRLQKDPESMTRKELTKLIAQVEKQMRAAAADLNFEQAAELRDKMIDLKKNLDTLDK